MPIETLPLRNAYNHLNYLVGCAATGEALAIDPFDPGAVLEAARRRHWRITQIVVTHEHWDHAGRVRELMQLSGARLLTHRSATATVEHVDVALEQDDCVRIGTSMELRVLYAPGHTMTHILLFGLDLGLPVLFSGDTLFAAGVGNCRYGGHTPSLYRSLQESIAPLPEATMLLPGHDYLYRNLEFTLAIEPDNGQAKSWLDARDVNSPQPRLTTLGDERRFNCFLRLSEDAVASGISRLIGGRLPLANEEQLFLALRQLRDEWRS